MTEISIIKGINRLISISFFLTCHFTVFAAVAPFKNEHPVVYECCFLITEFSLLWFILHIFSPEVLKTYDDIFFSTTPILWARNGGQYWKFFKRATKFNILPRNGDKKVKISIKFLSIEIEESSGILHGSFITRQEWRDERLIFRGLLSFNKEVKKYICGKSNA